MARTDGAPAAAVLALGRQPGREIGRRPGREARPRPLSRPRRRGSGNRVPAGQYDGLDLQRRRTDRLVEGGRHLSVVERALSIDDRAGQESGGLLRLVVEVDEVLAQLHRLQVQFIHEGGAQDLRPAKVQQWPDRFWSVTAASG